MRISKVSLVAAALTFAACDGPPSAPQTSEAPVQIAAPREFRPELGKRDRGFGEECSLAGAKDCLSGHCVQDSEDQSRFVCTVECPNGHCPDGWVCNRAAGQLLCFRAVQP